MELFLSILFGVLGLTGFSFYTVYSRCRSHLMIDIRNLIEDCRKLKSWDDRSESKLFSWVEGDERELHKKTLRDLHRIRNNMIKYWQIHLEMDEQEPYGSFQTDPQPFGTYLWVEIMGRLFKKKK